MPTGRYQPGVMLRESAWLPFYPELQTLTEYHMISLISKVTSMRTFVTFVAMVLVLPFMAVEGQDLTKSTCSCGHSSDPIRALENYDPVFVGAVDRISIDATGSHYQDVDLRVLRSFGDTDLPTLSEYRVITYGGCGLSCGYCDFEEDRLFLVYVTKEWVQDYDIPLVSLCSKTAPIEEAHADLEAYGALDLVEPKSKARCGGPDNVAMLQALALTLLVVCMNRTRAEAA